MGHPVLRQRGRPLETVDFRNPLIQKLIDDIIDTMHEYNGVGLVTPQVHVSLRLFVALLEEDPDRKTTATVLANPEIVPTPSKPGSSPPVRVRIGKTSCEFGTSDTGSYVQ